jgi:FkbH-like protein
MESIKLVIWDLDETFWKGTLSEEGVNSIPANIKLVKWLTGRGIMNSIVSKNNFTEAKLKLQEIGAWEYFVFPAIAWEAKGKLVQRVIEKCQLRSANVLFLDDNHMNLEEAKFYNEGLCVKLPSFICEIKNHPAFKGKDDSSHSRLKHYKILERKDVDKIEMYSNEEFLKESGIRIQYIEDLTDHTERLLEILNRTNQLNYTKKRLDLTEVKSLIENQKLQKKLIKVTDKYGDYGLVGFYAIDQLNNELEHFVFSCRIINLGIEQFIYSELNFPKIDIVPDVAIPLNSSKPDWISVIDKALMNPHMSEVKGDTSKCRILFKGECDLFQMLFYLQDYDCNVIRETNYTGENNFVINREHTQMLIDSREMPKKHVDYLVKNLPFIDRKSYRSRAFTGAYDVFVYSLVMDFTQEVYEHKKMDIKLPFGGKNINITDQNTWDKFIKSNRERNHEGISKKFLQFFTEQFVHKGKISIEDFKRNLSSIRRGIPLHVPIIFMNGAEVEFSAEWESYDLERSREMNLALDQFIEQTPNCYLVDIRKFVHSKDHVTYGMNRYKRRCYKEIAQDLIGILQSLNTIQIKKKKIALTPLIDLVKPLYRGVRRSFLRLKRSINNKLN